jgi:hypothetical protein
MNSMKSVGKLVCVLMMAVALAAPSFANAQDASSTTTRGGPRRQLATIVFAGLGGAVLGLSTLSFYGRPQDHLANIALGFAGGVIIGTSVVTYRAATNPSEFYGVRPQQEQDILLSQRSVVQAKRTPSLAFAFEF